MRIVIAMTGATGAMHGVCMHPTAIQNPSMTSSIAQSVSRPAAYSVYLSPHCQAEALEWLAPA
jgi:hypothetical protein